MTQRPFLMAFVAAVAVTAIGIAVSSPLRDSLDTTGAREMAREITAAIGKESEFLTSSARDIAAAGSFVPYLRNENALNLIRLMNDETSKRDIDLMMVADGNGVVLARSRSVGERGDNLALTTPWGRAVTKGETVAGVERGRLHPLILLAGTPLVRGGEHMGALFTVQNLNDGYARRFRDRYFAKDAEIVWYSRETGVTGTSVNDEAARGLLSAYFNTGSALFDDGTPFFHRTIEMRGAYYDATGIPLRTSEGAVEGGMVVLIPSHNDGTAIVFAGLIMLFFFILEVSFHMYALRFRLPGNRHMFIVVSVSLALFFLTFWGTRVWLARQAVTLKETSQVIYNSTLGFVPEYDSIDTRFEKRAAIVLQSGGEAINAVEATIAYDPSMIEVRDIITANSFCDPALFLERNIDDAEGIVRIACIVPTPGFKGSRGVVAELLFQPRREGIAALTFASGTRVLANDGLGTDVLRTAPPASYQIVRAAGDTARAGASPILFSYTHPNQERWYRSREVSLAWMPKEGYRYHYVLNQIPDTVPSGRDPSAESGGILQLTVPKDGAYYIHVRPERDGVFGETAHYKVMVDTTPPLSPVILASSERVRPGDVVRFEFKGKDALSGAQSGYYVKINEGFLLPVRSELYVPFPEEGTYALTVRVFDIAGNFSDGTVNVEVKK